MILINKSYLQVLILLILTAQKKNKTFHVVYENYPNYIFLKFISLINFFSLNNFKISSINKFRDNFVGIKDQDSINKVNECLKNLFSRSLRTGGQIFIENTQRSLLWKSVVIDKIFKYYFHSGNIDKDDNQYFQFIYDFLYRLRVNERNFLIKISILKSTIKYFLFFIKNIFIQKLKFISNKSEIRKLFDYSSLIIHSFSKSAENQKQDFIYNAIDMFAKDYKVKKVLDYESFVNLSIKNIALKIKIINVFKMVYYLLILIIKFFISFNFTIEAKLIIDKFIYLCFKNEKIKSELKIYTIDPVNNSIIPILYSLKQKGINIYFLSFSLARYYTQGFSDFNGPYSYVLSSNVGFEKMVKRSLFRGPIKNSKCYLSLVNLNNNVKNNSLDNKNKLIKIIVVEGVAQWFREISVSESNFFASILYNLDSRYKNINILIKKKKNNSYLEDYFASKYPDNTIQFSDAVRGFMGDFEVRDFILSYGFSSLALKTSELFNKPHIIFDKYDNSKKLWKDFYEESNVKPIFASSEKSLLKILMSK